MVSLDSICRWQLTPAELAHPGNQLKNPEGNNGANLVHSNKAPRIGSSFEWRSKLAATCSVQRSNQVLPMCRADLNRLSEPVSSAVEVKDQQAHPISV